MNLSKNFLAWYDNNKRILPWRISQNSNKKQYFRILSEFMLQQTQVKTVVPYFIKFVNKIPNLKILSTTSEKKVLKLWEGLGYYRRAINLRKTAKILIKNHKGKLPKKYKEIKKLPGIGDYSANALLALVYNNPSIPIDGNVKRLFSRLFLIDSKIKNFNEKIKKKTNKVFKTNRNADLAEALMEFGAIVCKPKNPLCENCNLIKYCKFYKKEVKILPSSKIFIKKKRFNIYCYLNRSKKKIALIKNEKLSFLKHFRIPETQIINENNNVKLRGWNFLLNYKNNISNVKMNINLFYKFTNTIPEKFKWYFIDKPNKEFIPSFTKKVFKKVEKLYI